MAAQGVRWLPILSQKHHLSSSSHLPGREQGSPVKWDYLSVLTVHVNNGEAVVSSQEMIYGPPPPHPSLDQSYHQRKPGVRTAPA